MSCNLPAFYMAKCDTCTRTVEAVRLTKTTEGPMWLCFDCRGEEVLSGVFKIKRQPVAFVTDERGVEYGVDSKGVIPPHENPYNKDDHFGWKHTGKVPKSKKHFI